MYKSQYLRRFESVSIPNQQSLEVAEGPVVETQIIDKASQEDAARRPASEFLEAGLKILTARAVLRDQPSGERSMAKTVAIFNAWTGNNISVQDGWRFMISLKQAREIQGFYNEDDYEDGTNYFALLGEEESSNLGRKKG